MDHVPGWKGSPTKPANKSAPDLTVSINGKTILHESKCFRFSEHNYSIPNKFPGLYSSIFLKE